MLLIEVLLYFGGNTKMNIITSITQKKRITLHKGKSPLFPGIENKLYDFFKFNRLLGNCITTASLVHQFLVLCLERKNDIIDTICHIIYRFMKRHYLTLRINTYIGQALP